MAYTKQTWADLPSKTTPINAERLTHIEDGIFSAAQTADTAASTAGTAAANVGIVSGRVDTLTERVNGLDTAVSNKVDKVAGKGLSTNDYDDTDKEKVDSLGTASTKNSTSVVTSSSDLVESGAVKDIVGWGNKNLFDPANIRTEVIATYVPIYVGSGTFAMSTNMPINTQGGANLFILAGNVSTGASTATNGLWSGQTRTVTAIDGYVTVASRNTDGVNPINYNHQLEVGSTATAYEPYHASVNDTLRDAEVIEGKNLLPYPYYDKTKTVSGINFTVNADGSVTVSGTSTDNAYFDLSTNFDTTKFSGMLLNGLPIIGGLSYRICSQNDRAGIQDFYDNNTVISNHGSNLRLAIRINNGTTISNPVTFYPMISKDGGEYKSYYVPLKDVVPTKADNSVIGTVEGANASKAWSVGEHFISGGQFKEVTQAIASGGAISSSNTVDKPIAELFTKQKITGISIDGTVLKEIVNNDSYVIPAYKLAVINLAVKVGTYAAWTSCLSGMPKPFNTTGLIVANVGKSTAMFLSLYKGGNCQLTNITGSDPSEDNIIQISATYNYDSL